MDGKNWNWLYVTLRKCSRSCEYFSPRYAYVGGQLVLSPQGRVLDNVYLLLMYMYGKNWNWLYMSP